MFKSNLRGDLAHWVLQLTCNRSVVSLNPIKGSRCVLWQENLPSLLSTDGFRNRFRCNLL